MTVDGKTNEFRLSGGETVKLGRVKFYIREIQTSSDDNQTDDDSLENQFIQDDSNPVNSQNNLDQNLRNEEQQYVDLLDQLLLPNEELKVEHLHEELKQDPSKVVKTRESRKTQCYQRLNEDFKYAESDVSFASAKD